MSLFETLACGLPVLGHHQSHPDGVAEDATHALVLSKALRQELKKYIRLGVTFAITSADDVAADERGWVDVFIEESHIPSLRRSTIGRAVSTSRGHAAVACTCRV